MAQISKSIDAETTEQLRVMWSAKLNRQSEPAAVINQREEGNLIKTLRKDAISKQSLRRIWRKSFAAKAVASILIPLNFFADIPNGRSEKSFGRGVAAIDFGRRRARHSVENFVRRRLFKTCNDTQAREEICSAFFSMYVNNANDFPNESRQNNYREKLLACYPIHPKLSDYLYDKWTSLEGFQKTRGVLRLMANVIHCLRLQNDQSALIMPGNVPLNFAPVRAELAKYFRGNWDAIINSEVDGDKSKSYKLDGNNLRFGRLNVAQKISRTIFMGTVRAVEEMKLAALRRTKSDLARFSRKI